MPCLGDPPGRPFFMMNLRSSPSRIPSALLRASLFAVTLTLFLASACAPTPAPTPFLPPTAESPLIEPTFIIHPTQAVVVVQSTPLPTIVPTSDPATCSNNLTFVQDLTIPDNTVATFGLSIDKQWLVQNSGTCHWNSDYRLKHIGGASLGAPEEIALYPARAGTQATVQILFTAPFTDGVYESAWQAVDPAGAAFGDPIYIRITVQ